MRSLIVIVLCLASLALLRGEERSHPEFEVLQQVKYEKLDGEYSITFTGKATALYEGHGEKIRGNYMLHPADGAVMISLEKRRPPAASTLLMFSPAAEGMLYGGPENMLAIASVKDKAKALLPHLDRKGRAEMLVGACRVYANSHDGILPKKLADLLPDNAHSRDIFGDRSPEETIKSFDYFGAGVSVKDDPNKIILRATEPTSDGKRIVVFLSGDGKIQAGE